jgi:hypothetical protein
MTTGNQSPPSKIDLGTARGTRITDRDVAVLRLLDEYGCVDAQRIKVKLWNANPKSRAHFRRIGILRGLNLIDIVLGDQGVGIGYRITKKGRGILLEKGASVTTQTNKKTYKTQFEHDQLLIEVRSILESSPVVKDFKSEAEVKYELLAGRRGPPDWKDALAVPDGTFIYEVPGQRIRVAVELELTQKSRARYFKILRGHLLNKTWGMAFYIVKDESLILKMRGLLDEIKSHDVRVRVARKINGVYLCSLEEFRRERLKANFSNGKETFSLGEVALNFGLA